MLSKLAAWYLKKKNVTVILNCSFNEAITIRTKDKVYHQNNHYINGTEFLFRDGSKHVFQKLEEWEK